MLSIIIYFETTLIKEAVIRGIRKNMKQNKRSSAGLRTPFYNYL